ncbi:MAG: hypothetical protein SF028_14555 [Candidatus Sumerlaeia bacterium]|nr:hypothetical protein [Candidatus Sumerlaeia bacterium]
MSELPNPDAPAETAPTNGASHQPAQTDAALARIDAIAGDWETKKATLEAVLADAARAKEALAEALQQALEAKDTATTNAQAAAALVAEVEERKRAFEGAEEAAETSIEATRAETESLKAEILAQRDIIKEVVNRGNQHLAALETDSTKHREAAGDAESNAAKAAEAKAAILATQESLRGLEGRANAAVTSIEAVKVDVLQKQEVVATKSAHVEDGRKYIDNARGELDKAVTAANHSTALVESIHQIARAVATNLDQLAATSQVTKATIDANAEAVASAMEVVDEHAKRVADLSKKADEVEKRIAASEAHLEELEAQAAERLRTIDELLPGATSAGLASAFHKRSQQFKGPEQAWQGIFLVSLLVFLGLAIFETTRVSVDPTTPAWDALLRMFLHRLPFIVPLVWLAVHASRQASIAKRMEEEYAFKATTSTSFEGYRRQMAEVGKDLTPGSPLAQLCGDTLRIIAAPPAHVYEGTRMDPTPATMAAETIPPVADGVARVAEAAKPGV